MKICSKCRLEKTKQSFCKKSNEKDGLYYYCKECVKEIRKGKKQYNEYKKKWNREYYQNNLEYKIKSNIRCRLHHSLKAKGEVKKNRSLKYLGCSIKKYKKHLENLWVEGMNWSNYGPYWEVDHIIPLSKGGSFHFTNTQPLTVIENREKSDKI